MKQNWICVIFGCSVNWDIGSGCSRCGAYAYDTWPGVFATPIGKVRGFFDKILRAILQALPHKCCQCGKTVMFKNFCSEKCENDWVPF
jgi:hypothetical protein